MELLGEPLPLPDELHPGIHIRGHKGLTGIFTHPDGYLHTLTHVYTYGYTQIHKAEVVSRERE